MGKPEGRRPLGIPRPRRKESIKMDMGRGGMGRGGGMHWIDLAQDRDRWRVVNAVMNIWVP
jgi:hypothetical protein